MRALCLASGLVRCSPYPAPPLPLPQLEKISKLEKLVQEIGTEQRRLEGLLSLSQSDLDRSNPLRKQSEAPVPSHLGAVIRPVLSSTIDPPAEQAHLSTSSPPAAVSTSSATTTTATTTATSTSEAEPEPRLTGQKRKTSGPASSAFMPPSVLAAATAANDDDEAAAAKKRKKKRKLSSKKTLEDFGLGDDGQEAKYEEWLPPVARGDGKTHLNERFNY